MKRHFYPFIICLFLSLFLYSIPNPFAYASDCINRPQYSYLEHNNKSLFFDNVQSYCFICWGEDEDDPWTGRQSHNILYIDDPKFKVKTKLTSIKEDRAIIFLIRFYKFRNEEITDKKIILPNDRFSFYSYSDNQNKRDKTSEDKLTKLNIESEYIKIIRN